MTEEVFNKLKEKEPERLIELGLCPDCGTELFYAEGCRYCPICGWSACK